MSLTAAERTKLNTMCPVANLTTLGTRVGALEDYLLMKYKNVWYVDATSGSDTYAGTTMSTAKATIGAARTLNSASIDWAHNAYQRNVIVVTPEVYAEALGGFYYCDVIGLGIRGTDGEAEIHPAAGSPIDGDATLLNAGFFNLRFETDEAEPCVDAGIVNSTMFRSCTFTNGAAVAATGIDLTNSTHLVVEDCDFESGQTTGLAYGIYARGGADKYLHNARIRGNRIFAATAGIYIAADCTASQAIISDNFIGPAACLKGIDDNNGGSYCVNNRICAVDGIEHPNSNTQCVGNIVNAAGTTVWEDAI